jgi:hypothetical protein
VAVICSVPSTTRSTENDSFPRLEPLSIGRHGGDSVPRSRRVEVVTTVGGATGYWATASSLADTSPRGR